MSDGTKPVGGGEAGGEAGSAGAGNLAGVRVVEIADELAEYCGLTLAGLGAEVIKIEPVGGNPTRRIGPFFEDREGPERSLHFWHYNRGKRSLVLDCKAQADRERLLALLANADVLLQSVSVEHPDPIGLSVDELRKRFPRLVIARMTPFGDEGPWASYKSSDLVHLALGGVAMNCGYDPEPDGRYDLPPIAPQMWQAYHIAGEQLAIGVVGALIYRQRSGTGQYISCAVHGAVSINTENDVPAWILRRAPFYRQTNRHSMQFRDNVPTIGSTKDGRWLMTFSYGEGSDFKLHKFLDKSGMTDLPLPGLDAMPGTAGAIPGSSKMGDSLARLTEAAHRLVRSYTYERAPWRAAQEAGLLWAPLRKPHENALDEHWKQRKTFTEIEHPELGRSFCYPTSKWMSTAGAWQPGRRAPLLNEDAGELPRWLKAPAASVPAVPASPSPEKLSRHGKPFALKDVRILDFSWYLATAGGTRFAASLGVECIKTEWKSHPDTRFGNMAPVGGREARRRATAPLEAMNNPDMGGQFNNKNPGKRGFSLNVTHPKGLDIARRLVAVSDVVAEGFSPGVLQKWGLGYDALRAIKPDIIYVQQSGMGSGGTYGRFRTVGPIAAAFSGISEMSGLPEPAMPVGWGYSYLDWLGAYTFALAILSALHHRNRTGEGQWISSSQCEVGIFASGTSILDWSANGRIWQRYGNRSPYKPAAPHGIYPCLGEDRWLAIACFTDTEWSALAKLAGHPEWALDPRFSSLAARLAHQDELDAMVGCWTLTQERYDAMHRLQAAGVPAGVCQTAEDRCDTDPQLAALNWLTEVTGTRIGTWPVYEMPTRMSETPTYAGGPIDRGAPYYGEDNEYVLGELLGMNAAQIAALRSEGVID
jgi:crotonobetainyl-CoA:carnitine CoA-transferase CaiB-like acyl-CoA transferase